LNTTERISLAITNQKYAGWCTNGCTLFFSRDDP
jgi:hypothetical protein